MTVADLCGITRHSEIGWCFCTGVAVLVYGLVGVFGAARFGRDTAGDILVNTWLGGRAEGFLDLAVTAYLAISMPPVQVRLVSRATLRAP